VPRGGLLRQRDFRSLWFGETVSGTGTAMAGFVIPLLAVSVLRASTFEVAALSAATYLPWLVIALPAGAWVDRLPPRPLMIGCDVVAAALYASLPIAAWSGVLSMGQLLAIALLAGAVSVVFTTAYQVYLPSLVSAGDLVEGNAKLQGSASMASIAGRGTAGLAADAVGPAGAVLFNAASFGVSAVCLLRIRATAARPARAASSVRADIARGMRFVVRDQYLRPLTVFAAASNFTYGGYAALTVIFLVKTAGLGPAPAGLLMSVGSVGGLAGAFAARRLAGRFGLVPVLVLASLVTGPFGLLIPLTRTGPWVTCYLAGAAVLGAGILIANILAATFRQTHCPPEMLGRVVAGMRFLAFGAIPLGALLAGAFGTALGVRNALWIVLGGNTLCAAILLPLLRRDPDRMPPVKAGCEGEGGLSRPLRPGLGGARGSGGGRCGG
jgi:MFS family permease